MTKYPRSIYFYAGKATGSFPVGRYDSMKTMFLPSDHYDFLGPISVIGKTEKQILAEVNAIDCGEIK